MFNSVEKKLTLSCFDVLRMILFTLYLVVIGIFIIIQVSLDKFPREFQVKGQSIE